MLDFYPKLKHAQGPRIENLDAGQGTGIENLEAENENLEATNNNLEVCEKNQKINLIQTYI